MRPQYFDITPQSDDDGICALQSASSGGEQSLILNGALVSDGVASLTNADHLISITSGSNNSSIAFTISGKDYRGQSIEETLAGPNNTTVNSTYYYRSVSSIKVSGDTTNTVKVGVSGKCVSDLATFDTLQKVFSVSFEVEVPTSPTPNLTYSVINTMDDIQVNNPLGNLSWIPHDVINSKTDTQDGSYSHPVVAARVQVTAYTSGVLKFKVIQGGR